MFEKKYRPKFFKDIIGAANKLIVGTLRTFITNGNLAHSLLLTGLRGTGKTTVARIIANKLNCNEENINLFEINASSDRGIDKARSIINTARYMPHIGDKKVFIFDEAHQITKDFSEAILKITEDTPDHIYFIYCTSKPDLLDEALKSRLQEYKMTQCNSREICSLLKRICIEEDISVSKKVINYISANSDGVPREALISLHKVMNLEEEDALKILMQDEIDEDIFINLVQGLMGNKPWKSIRKLVNKCKKDPEKTRRGVLSYISSCILNDDEINPRHMLIYDAFSQSFVKTGRDGFNGLIFACAVCSEGA